MVEETEVEWDDEERTRMRGLAAYEAGICECGFHSALTSDPANYFTFEDARCNVCKVAAQYDRIQHAADDEDEKRAGDKVPPHRIKPSDGRRTYIRRMTKAEAQPQRT